MDKKFIYVFDEKSRDLLLSMGFALLKSNEQQPVYIFQNEPKLCLHFDKRQIVTSDVLTF